ncbi:MAG TPA: hypothetical protein VMW56_11685 [Candidatus Margulisiibacteriota bacterium]|nr:hypothetical protein [Candidatus Margulisiibacteriota bacterium]
MRNSCRVVWCGLGVSVLFGLSACAAKKPVKSNIDTAAAVEATPMPTVPPKTPTPEVAAAPLPTRPVGKQAKAGKGAAIGPVVTFFGAARADGSTVEPVSVEKGVPVYRSEVGSGFMLVVEVKAGESGYEPGRRVSAYVPGDPKVRPDLEIETSRDMGNGSPEVCDRQRPNIGGIPGINPPSFAETQKISDAINDFGCRFETFIESDGSCTLSKSGDYSFVSKDTTTQFCMIVARAYIFPVGKTLLSVRVRDSEGNPGPVKQMWIYRPTIPAARPPKPAKH